jgi:hypothetical protein
VVFSAAPALESAVNEPTVQKQIAKYRQRPRINMLPT